MLLSEKEASTYRRKASKNKISDIERVGSIAEAVAVPYIRRLRTTNGETLAFIQADAAVIYGTSMYELGRREGISKNRDSPKTQKNLQKPNYPKTQKNPTTPKPNTTQKG